MMRRYRLLGPVGFAFLMLAGCAAQPGGTGAPAAQTALAAAPALQPDMARVWILRQKDVEAPFQGADPAVFVNNVDLGHIAQGTVFYHDLPPGTYRFRVQPYGTPTHVVDTVQFGPGVTGFLQVQEVPNWEQGSTYQGVSFTVLTMVPQDAEVAIPTLTFLGRR
jgi:hypothetical protein